MLSKISEVGTFHLPEFNGDRLYMHALDVQDPQLPSRVGRYRPLIDQLMPYVPLKEGIVYLTIDEKMIVPGTSHRRPGAHIDGIWQPAVQAHSIPPTHIIPAPSPSQTRLQTRLKSGGHDIPSPGWNDPEVDGGGLILLANQVGCRAYVGDFDCVPGSGGDCEHIRDQLDAAPSFLMKANKAYLCNVWGVHESLPATQQTRRSLVRITLPVEAKV
jgi:hypothetical protein